MYNADVWWRVHLDVFPLDVVQRFQIKEFVGEKIMFSSSKMLS